MMVVKLLGRKGVATMRSPLARILLVTISALFLIYSLLRTESPPVAANLFGKSGVKSSVQRPAESQKSPIDQVPVDSPTGGDYTLNCSVDLHHLSQIKDQYGLDNRLQYTKRYVRFSRKQGLERKGMTKLSQNLLPGSFSTIDLGQGYYGGTDSCAEPINVDVSASGFPSTVNASDFMFGVSTTYHRFMDGSTSPINEWAFWLTNSHGKSNGGKLLLMLLDASNEELQEVANLLGDVGIDVEVFHSDSSVEMAVRYLTLVPTLYTHADSQKKKWLVMCDDDTFFPNMHALIAKFETFDHTREMYIGTLSEDVGAVERHGSQAFGGAGVFLSLSMARKITDLYTSCASEEKVQESNTGWGPQGDVLLRKCIYENTQIRLTTVWDLWQLDFFGDPSGFYEWGMKPLSLHHYRGGVWHKASPGQYAKIAHICGEDCTLQRFQTADGFIISGYSVAQYPQGIDFDTAQMECTLWPAPTNKGWNMDYMFGPQRSLLSKTGRKISWEMKESELRPDGSLLQTYTRKKDDARWVYPDGQAMSNIDGVIELVWIPS